MVIGLQQEIQPSEESRYYHRLHGVLLVAQDMTFPEASARHFKRVTRPGRSRVAAS